jgi:hypothetical protein
VKITRAELINRLVEDMERGWDQETIKGYALDERRRRLTGLPISELLDEAAQALLDGYEDFEIVLEDASKWSHQYVVAITVESKQADPHEVPLEILVAALARRIAEIIGPTEDGLPGDGREAFQPTDTTAIS